MRILIIEDEERIANFMRKLLIKKGYAIDMAVNGEDALTMLKTSLFDLILLDINLPVIGGLEVCARIRRGGNKVPIIMLTSRGNTADKVAGLDSGADDYVTKPFEPEELFARIRAALRKNRDSIKNRIKVGNIALDINKREVKKGNKVVSLSAKEYAMFEYMMLSKGKAVSRKELLEHIWGSSQEQVYTNTVDVHISYLRKKLGDDAIKTCKGFGYMIDDES